MLVVQCAETITRNYGDAHDRFNLESYFRFVEVLYVVRENASLHKRSDDQSGWVISCESDTVEEND